MRHPQVVVYESDGRLAALLRETCRQSHWPLREPRQPDNVLHLLKEGGPSVLLLKIDPEPAPRSSKEAEKGRRRPRELERQLALLEQVHRLLPATATVVVCETDQEALAGLAWDLGAHYVLTPPQPWDLLPAIVAGLMQATGESAAAGAPRPLPTASNAINDS